MTYKHIAQKREKIKGMKLNTKHKRLVFYEKKKKRLKKKVLLLPSLVDLNLFIQLSVVATMLCHL